ncbi:MAG: hypothetical protein WCI01_01475 [Chlorobiaceae bacterium]
MAKTRDAFTTDNNGGIMVELSARGDKLVFRFPDVHPEATLSIQFQRTLRIPDDGKDYPLPPGLGHFPLRLVDDYPATVPESWKKNGGVMMPMYQAEALWLCFNTEDVDNRASYPFAIKIATGKLSAVSGQPMRKGLNMEPQDYVVAPRQPWLDGYCVEKGVIRQFVAMPLGQGYSAEEQITGNSEFGGLQLLVYPMKRKAFERRFQKRRAIAERRKVFWDSSTSACSCEPPDMGLSPGGRMKQEIYEDPYNPEEWDLENSSHCFVHIANSEIWSEITGKKPPHRPYTSADYSRCGLPWFDYYAEEGATAIDGAETLQGLKSVKELGALKKENPLPENESPEKMQVQDIGSGPKIVRDGELESSYPIGENPDRKTDPGEDNTIQTGEKKMKQGYTHITVILDRSGSMESICDDTIGGLNAFVEQQKAGSGEATLTLVQFDSQHPYEVIHHFTPIREVPALTRKTYVPRGGTPLLDALGRGINDIEESIGKLNDGERPEKVIVAVITDGQENSSMEFNKEQVEKMIKSKSSEAGWEFIFLSADLNAIADAHHLGFSSDATVAFEKSSHGVDCCMSSLSESVSQIRSGVIRKNDHSHL